MTFGKKSRNGSGKFRKGETMELTKQERYILFRATRETARDWPDRNIDYDKLKINGYCYIRCGRIILTNKGRDVAFNVAKKKSIDYAKKALDTAMKSNIPDIRYFLSWLFHVERLSGNSEDVGIWSAVHASCNEKGEKKTADYYASVLECALADLAAM